MLKKIPKTAFFQTPKNLNSTGPKLGIIWNSTSKTPFLLPKKKKNSFLPTPTPNYVTPKPKI